MSCLGRSKYILSFPLVCLAGPVFAGPPVPYDQWSIEASGRINTSVSCSDPAVTCERMAEDVGFLQEMVDMGDYVYIRLVVADDSITGGATDLDFTVESFVPFAEGLTGASQGVASKQAVRDAAQGFESISEVQRSMMRYSNPALLVFSDPLPYTAPEDFFSIKISQTLKSTDAATGTEFSDSFKYIGYTAFDRTFPNYDVDSDEVIGRAMDISQYVDLGDAADPRSMQQFFEHKQRMGTTGNYVLGMVDQSPVPPGSNIPPNPFDPGSIPEWDWVTPMNEAGNYYYTLGTPLSPAGDMTVGGSTVAWEDGDEVVTSWLVQTGTFSSDTAMSYQTVKNRTTDAFARDMVINVDTTSGISPFDWNESTFGVTPTINPPVDIIP
jgi:hypothetical protein